MFFWKTNRLASVIKEGGLTETNRKNYYLAGTMLVTIDVYMNLLSVPHNIYAILVGVTSLILITIFGIKITFSSNKGKDGTDYLGRMIALSFPLIIKSLLISLIIGVLLAKYDVLNGDRNVQSWHFVIVATAIQAWIFWRLNVHIKFINA